MSARHKVYLYDLIEPKLIIYLVELSLLWTIMYLSQFVDSWAVYERV